MTSQIKKKTNTWNFFKPNLWKIILTAIIFLILLLIFGTPKQYVLKCTKNACGAYIEFIGITINASTMTGTAISLIFFATYLIEILISYLVSCLIISIFKNV